MKNKNLKIEYKNIDELIPYVNNARKNESAVDKVASSIKNFGMVNPILIDKENEIIAGHTRLLALKKLGYKNTPTIKLEDLSEAEVKALRLADNKTSEFSEWDFEKLEIELEQIENLELDFEMDEFGFEEIDSVFSEENFEEINFEGKESGTSVERKLSFSNKNLIITEEEEEMLIDVFEEYVKEKGVSFGFVRWLINER